MAGDGPGGLRRGPIVAILLIALLLKAVVLLVVLPNLNDKLMPHYGVNFADAYDRLAYNVAAGNGYRFGPDLPETLMREPGYPLFLAGVFKLFGDGINAARFANFLLAIGVAFLVARLARRISTDAAIPVLAALLFLIHPGVFIAEARGGVELLFIFLLMLFIVALYRATDTERARDYVTAGLALGLVVMVRSTPVLFPVFLFGYFVVAAPDSNARARVAKNMSLMVAAMAIVMSPWIIRNYLLVGQFVPTSSVLGVSMQSGQYVCEHLTLDRGPQDIDAAGAVPQRTQLARSLGYEFKDEYYQYFYRTQDELAFNRTLLSNAIQRYWDHPRVLAKCLAVNTFNFWFLGKSWNVTWLNTAIQLPFLIAAFAGGYRLVRTGHARTIAILVLFIFYLWAVHLPINAQARYSVPLVPFLAILASAWVGALLSRMRQWKWSARGVRAPSDSCARAD